jgi:predicted MPP superfamily phosphohydrolase
MFLAYFLFLLFVLAFILGIHWFFYFSVIRFLHIERHRGIKIFFYLGIIASFSFILSSFLVRVDSGWLMRLYYLSSALWMGFLVNLTLAVSVLWFLRLVYFKIKCRFSFPKITLVVLAFFFFFSFWGIYHAFDIEIKNIDVALQNLPDEWRGKKIMHISDTHYGQVHGVWAVQRLINIVDEERPDLVLITGDLFDGTDGNMDSLIANIARIKAPEGVYFTSGNHDFYAGEEKIDVDLKKVGVNVLSDGFVDLRGLQLAGINYSFKWQEDSHKKTIESWPNYSHDKPTVLMHHIPDRIDEFADAGVDLLLCGHTHRGQMFPFGLITNFIFKGYDYGLKNYNALQVYTSSGTGTWGPPMRTSGDSEVVILNLK